VRTGAVRLVISRGEHLQRTLCAWPEPGPPRAPQSS
jgi:hypothetical protein